MNKTIKTTIKCLLGYLVFVLFLTLVTGCGKQDGPDPVAKYLCPEGVTCCHDPETGNPVLCRVVHPY